MRYCWNPEPTTTRTWSIFCGSRRSNFWIEHADRYITSYSTLFEFILHRTSHFNSVSNGYNLQYTVFALYLLTAIVKREHQQGHNAQKKFLREFIVNIECHFNLMSCYFYDVHIWIWEILSSLSRWWWWARRGAWSLRVLAWSEVEFWISPLPSITFFFWSSSSKHWDHSLLFEENNLSLFLDP